jgi:hypothetical protein
VTLCWVLAVAYATLCDGMHGAMDAPPVSFCAWCCCVRQLLSNQTTSGQQRQAAAVLLRMCKRRACA